MRKFQLLALITLVATSLGVSQNQGANSSSAPPSQSSTPIVNPEPQSSWIRILTPVAGQTLSANFAELRFELIRPSLSGEPNFLVQLDSADPISMSSTSYTFSELQPGVHAIQVTLVDANNSPMEGGIATVRFKVPAPKLPSHNDGGNHVSKQQLTSSVIGKTPAAPIPPELRKVGDPILPLAGSPLPLLSLIGFGLLIGGAAQAMRTRSH